MCIIFSIALKLFFKEILLIPLSTTGKVTYYAIRIEFQVRGSPPVHSFIWTLNPPKLSEETLGTYIEFINNTIHANSSAPDNDLVLYELVNQYQTHKHSKICRKYKHKLCRYGFGKFFTEKTIIAQPLDDGIEDVERYSILKKRDTILSKVSDFINKYLDPSKDTYQKDLSIDCVLLELQLTKKQYYWALSMSSESDFKLHLKRDTNSCFINNYSPVLLKAWQVNIDLQPVYNYYKAASYMTAYFSNSENSTSDAVKQAVQEIKLQNLSARLAMKKLVYSFICSRTMSVQEAVYLCLPELWLRKCQPGVMFLNTNLPHERIRLLKTEKELLEMPADSKDIYKSGIIEKYIDRPTTGKVSALRNLCVAEFATMHHKKISYDDNDFQSNNLPDPIDTNDSQLMEFPKLIKFSATGEILSRRNRKIVLRYQKPNKEIHPEKSAHCLLILLYPFTDEKKLVINGSYVSKLNEENLLETINQNKQIFEPNLDLIETYIHQIHHERNTYQDDNHSVENIDFAVEASNTQVHNSIGCSGDPQQIASVQADDNDLRKAVCSSNLRQRKIFNTVCHWARNTLKQMNSVFENVVEPLHLFITGGAGVGKSRLVTILTSFLTKTFNLYSGTPDKKKYYFLLQLV